MPETKNTHPEGVPLNLWLVAPPGDAQALRRKLAAQAAEAYSAPGAVVIDLFPSAAEIATTIALAGRAALTLPCAGDAGVPDMSGWADLALALPTPDPTGESAAAEPWSPASAGAIAATAAAVLWPGGFLVVGSAGLAGSGEDAVTTVVEAAAAYGLAYFQHVVVLLCDETAPIGHVDLLVFVRKAG